MRYRPPNVLHRGRGLGWVILVVSIAATVASGALADTVYLKNGRVIRTPRARVDGDALRFVQYGQEASIPMALVDRIVDDDLEGPEPREPGPGREDAVDDTGDRVEVGDEADDGTVQEEVPPEQTREYWQERAREISDERQQLEETLTDLRREERAFLFSHRSTAEVRRQIEAAEQRLQDLDQAMSDLRREARRQGVPAGWLRI